MMTHTELTDDFENKKLLQQNVPKVFRSISDPTRWQLFNWTEKDGANRMTSHSGDSGFIKESEQL